MLESKTQSGEDSLHLSQAETDAILAAVNEQLALNSFNPDDQELLKQMIESMGDSRGMVRLSFAEALGKVGKPATPLLMEAVANHPNPVVRRASAKTLTLIADPIAVPTLVNALLNDEDTVVKTSAVGGLAKIGEAAVPALLKILASTEYPESAKGHAVWALGFIGAEAKEHLYREINSDSADVRAAVVGAIAKIAEEGTEEGAFHILVNALTDSSLMVRCEAASALGSLAYQPAIPNLVELLLHPDWETRKAAALALMKIGDRTALEPLQVALTQEQEAGVQVVIELAISQIERQLEENAW
ncbi:HEAT repeat domain-containing protein [Nostoc sp. UCD121]|uniref:HEAT repeat domain-containing protein n=1 Tax=unclassified Nostoc TaxID=2593658 RepID=UPI001624C5A5|nr:MULTISPECIES: HEAT repeat domain-containing protein [unclassified Nostoc]MBC1221874.1 HEAT repeat domain-containing protein [Nostoc sp. UCD120]MBC1275960.1 HEAT repeat domain-containing protein [Nostoc sp. UCD121]MBC1293444.1 HEAT repeat domain-containing protein [Nostoc sp. UCD122]MBC1293491.1 HEAT repeat domain-containing protein [Nostoc sp. UCD122]